MNIKRFVGKNSREALSMVKRALGENAIILSNRAVHGGNEIMAFREEDMANMVSSAETAFPLYNAQLMTTANTEGIDTYGEELSGATKPHADESRLSSIAAMFSKRKPAPKERVTIDDPVLHLDDIPARKRPASAQVNMTAEELLPVRNAPVAAQKQPELKAAPAPEARAAQPVQKNTVQAPVAKAVAAKSAPVATTRPRPAAARPEPASVRQELVAAKQEAVAAKQEIENALSKAERAETNQQIQTMLGEIRTMRDMIASQLTEISWNNIQQRDPAKSMLLSSLLSAGFSASLARQLAESAPRTKTHAEGLKWVQEILAKNISTMHNEEEVLDRGGVFALIGPTGVGKTTTTAKLAARYVMKHGTSNLGLITTDAYRIGGHEQLRIYGKILGVMVHAVKDEADLKIALNELKNKHTILIDTVGVSQRDRMVAEQISMLTNANQNIKKLICLNATNTGETLTDVINAYKGRGLDGCIVTKLDEAATIGNTLDVIIREKLKMYYVANGQRVPEDIHLANKDYLVRQAMKLGANKNTPFTFREEELPFIMGTTNNAKKAVLMEANHG